MEAKVTLTSLILEELASGSKTEEELVAKCGSNMTAVKRRLGSLLAYARVASVAPKLWAVVLLSPRPAMVIELKAPPRTVNMASIRKANELNGKVAGPYRPVVVGSYVPPPEIYRRSGA